MSQIKIKMLLCFSLLATFVCGTMNCDKNSAGDEIFYTFTDWNRSLMDSINVSFSIDSVFKPVSCGMDRFDDSRKCYAFGHKDCKITINYWIIPKAVAPTLELFTKWSETRIIQIREVYPERGIKQPKRIEADALDGMMIESSEPGLRAVNYVGHNKEMYMSFDIRLETSDTTMNAYDILLSLVESISIQKKK